MSTFLRPLELEEVAFLCSCQEETESLDDAFDDEETRRHCREELRRDNVWGWCEVTVRASWNGFTGEAYLGGCSYKSKEDFVENSGYYEDMCMEAFNDLCDALEEAARQLEPLVTRESVDCWIVAKVQND